MMSSGSCNNSNNSNTKNKSDEHIDQLARGTERPDDDSEGQILLRQVQNNGDKARRGHRHRSTSASCQLDMTASSHEENEPSRRQQRQYPGEVPTVSIAVHECGDQNDETTGDDNVEKGHKEPSDNQEGKNDHAAIRRVDSATSTTSDVNSYDDAASIASRLSQIVDEQEFLLINNLNCNKRDEATGGQVAPSQSMGNLLLAYDGKPQMHRTTGARERHHQQQQQQCGPEARSASALAVNRLAGGSGGGSSSSCIPSASATSLNIDKFPKGRSQRAADANNNDSDSKQTRWESSNKRVRTKSFAGQEASTGVRQVAISERRNESSGSLYTRHQPHANFQPERGNLRLLESSRQQAQAMAAASRLRSESVGGDNGLMLNIRRSAWKLDEFEQAFKPPDSSDSSDGGDSPTLSGQQAGEAPNDFRRSTRNLLLSSFRKVVGGGGGSGDKQRHGSMSEGVATAPDGSVRVNLGAATRQEKPQQQQQVVTINLADPTSDNQIKNKRQLNSNMQFSYQQEQVNNGGGVGGKNYHMLSANLSAMTQTQPRRGSRISLSSFASSLDSSKSAKPFGRLGELLATSHRRKHQKDRGGGYHGDTPPRRPSGRTGAADGDDGGDDGSRCCSMGTLKQYFPVLEWLPAYKWRADFLPDLTAGLAVAVLNISTSLSAAVVAETDLGVAFRSSIINTLVYALLCSSRHTSFGSWSIMSQMLLDSVRRALSDELILSRINLGPQVYWTAEEYETWHMNIIIMYTFLIGLVQLAAGLLNLGNLLASFIPEALCSSMIAATAFTMAIGQLANMCGTSNKILWAVEKNTTEELAWSLDLENSPVSITDLFAGLFRWIQQIALLVKHYNQINLAALAISLTCVLLLALNQYYLQAKLRQIFKKDNLFLPFEMVLLILWIGISYALNLPGAPYRVTTCGPISIEFGVPNLPNLRLFRELWFDSLATALISYTMVFIMARTYSNKLNYEINNNQELVACGAGNLVGGLFDALPATASFSRTAGQVEAGGRTQMASLINCLALTLMVQLFGHHVAQLPVCVMSATLFFGFVRMMARFQEAFIYWRICKVDFAIWIVTFVAILTLDLVTGFVYGFIFSILTMLYRAQTRRCYLLGSIGSSADVYVPLAKYPLARELDHIKIFQFCGPIHYLCADLFEKLLRQKTRVNVKEILKQIEQKQQVFDPRSRNLPTHIILDFSMISFIDSAGIHVIKKIIVDFQRINMTVMLASLASHVAQVVKSEPSLWQVHKDRFYVTLADAVHHALRDSQTVSAIGGNQQQQQQSPFCTINK